jgi:RimJ/RimL family protein N-acetyltransferase
MSPRDGQAIYKSVTQSLTELKRFMSWAHFDHNPTIYAEFERKSLKGEEAHYAGFDLSTGEFLFCCSLLPGSRLNPLAFEIGFWVSSSKTGKGLGTIAAKILIVLAFSQYQADRVSVVCNLENIRSLRVVEKVGFHFEGCLRNHLMRPTPAMVANGYSAVTDVKAFSLTSKDIPNLPWFKDFSSKLTFEF